MSATEIKVAHEEDVLNQSSSTWRHSIIKHTFPRDGRFRQRANVNHSMYNLNSPTATKVCGIGFGDKYYIPIWERKKMKELPGPNRYGNFSSSARTTRRSFSKSSRFLQPHDGMPGPGNYELTKSHYAKDITIKGRFTEAMIKPQPGPAEYTIKDPHASVARSITLKMRWRADRIPKTPGPGSYEISNWPKTAKARYKRTIQTPLD